MNCPREILMKIFFAPLVRHCFLWSTNLGMPFDFMNIWLPNSYPFDEIVCILQGLLIETSTNATILTITSFTCERYIAICHPFRWVKWSICHFQSPRVKKTSRQRRLVEVFAFFHLNFKAQRWKIALRRIGASKPISPSFHMKSSALGAGSIPPEPKILSTSWEEIEAIQMLKGYFSASPRLFAVSSHCPFWWQLSSFPNTETTSVRVKRADFRIFFFFLLKYFLSSFVGLRKEKVKAA